jgi:hypothetical protein
VATVVWLNGTFGAGKTTTANVVVGRDATLRAFDPEWVGFMLRMNLADQEATDFQHLPPWRRLVPVVAREIADLTGQRLVTVQTVLIEDYWRELRAGLDEQRLDVVHVLLDADDDALRARIEGDTVDVNARQWRLDHLDEYRAARPWMTAAADLVIDTTARTADDVATLLLDAV